LAAVNILGPDPRQQHRKAKWLGDIIVGAGLQPENRIRIGIVAGQHDDRSLEAALAQGANDLATIGVRQADIHQDEVRRIGFGSAGSLGARVDGGSLEFVVQR
jgi:hypothetical protein